jgi:hypothetical protein
MDPATKGIGHHRPSRYLLYYRLISHRETPDHPAIRSHPSIITTIRAIDVPANSRI